MKFPDDRMTITQVIPHLWQGAMPMPDSNMAEYGVGPHPEGYGPALNNNNFRAYVESVST